MNTGNPTVRFIGQINTRTRKQNFNDLIGYGDLNYSIDHMLEF